jgi:hypothetical protein
MWYRARLLLLRVIIYKMTAVTLGFVTNLYHVVPGGSYRKRDMKLKGSHLCLDTHFRTKQKSPHFRFYQFYPGDFAEEAIQSQETSRGPHRP